MADTQEIEIAKKFAEKYYQLDKSMVSSVTIKSAIKFAQRYHEHRIDMAFEQIEKTQKKIASDLEQGNAASWLKNNL